MLDFAAALDPPLEVSHTLEAQVILRTFKKDWPFQKISFIIAKK